MEGLRVPLLRGKGRGMDLEEGVRPEIAFVAKSLDVECPRCGAVNHYVIGRGPDCCDWDLLFERGRGDELECRACGAEFSVRGEDCEMWREGR